ncbi:MAG: hypothetical protein F7C35_07885, partial [Desulfurococcales archaeon]|nr:hypothetical protein [Desulfurococcales archaeon]
DVYKRQLLEPSTGGGGGWFIVVPESDVSVGVSKYFPFEVRIIPIMLPPGYNCWNATIDWGDGNTSEVWPHLQPYPCGGAMEALVASHTYTSDGVKTVTVHIYALQMEFGGTEGDSDVIISQMEVYNTTIPINVTSPWREYAGIVRQTLGSVQGNGTWEGLAAWAIRTAANASATFFEKVTDWMARKLASRFNPGYAMYYLVAMPETGRFPGFRMVYDELVQWGWLALVILAYIGLLWRGLFRAEEGSSALMEWLKLVLLAGAGIYLALPLYDAAARAWNIVTLSVARLGELGSLYMMLAAGVFVLSAMGIVAPSTGALAAMLVALAAGVILLGLLKWLLAATLVAMLPIAIPLYVAGGPLAGAARKVISMLVGLFIFSLAAAVMSALTVSFSLTLTQTPEGKSLVFAAALPIVNAVAGYILTQTAAPGALPGPLILRRTTPLPAPLPAPTPLPRPPTPAPTTALAPGAATLGAAASGTVVGTAPTPAPAHLGPVGGATGGLHPAAVGYIHTGPPMIGPERRPTEEKPTTLRQAAVEKAKALGKTTIHTIARNIQEFDKTLSKHLGITITKPARERALPALKYSYKAVKWAAPRITKYGSIMVRAARDRLAARLRYSRSSGSQYSSLEES